MACVDRRSGTGTAFGCSRCSRTARFGSYGPAKGDTLTVPVLLEATPGHNIAGLQFELEFDADALSLPPKSAVKTGSESARAEKQVSYSLIAPGKARVLVVGFNRNTLAGGEIVSIEFSLRRDRVELFEPVRVKNAVLSDLAGRKIPETSEDGGIRFSVAAVESNPNPSSDVSKTLIAG